MGVDSSTVELSEEPLSNRLGTFQHIHYITGDARVLPFRDNSGQTACTPDHQLTIPAVAAALTDPPFGKRFEGTVELLKAALKESKADSGLRSLCSA